MKTLLTLLVSLSVSLSAFAGIPYVISPTNTPTLGMQLFSGGPAGVNYWDWATNSAGSNSTVVSASASISITTNGFNFTPFLSAQVTNWITGQDTVVSNGVYGLFNGGTNITFGYARSLSAADTNNDTVVSNGVYGLFNGGTNITFGYARSLSAADTNNDTVVSNGVYGLFNGGTNLTFGYARSIGGFATNNDTVVSNGVFGQLNTGTNDAFVYARSVVGVGATNQDLKTSNTLWLTITNNYLAAGDSSVTITTNRSGQNLVWSIISNAGGSGTGIQTNNGTGTNNIFSNPILQGAPGSTDSNILYISAAAGPTNWVFRTNGDLVNLGSGKIFSLLSNTANTNAAGSGVAFLDDLNAASNTAYAYARTIGAAATNQDLKTSNTLWLDITNNYLAAGDASVTITTNRSGQNLVWSIIANAGGSGTGVQTNGGSGTNNIFVGPAISSAFLSGTNSSVRYGTTNGFQTTWNILDFGASPAAADNTAAIQAALNAASTNKGSVFIPASSNAFTFTGTITIPKFVTLKGEGTPHSGAGSYLYNSTAGTLIVLSDGAVIKSVTINGGGVANAQKGIVTSGDPANYTTTFQILDCQIKNLGWGIYGSNCWTAQLWGNDISACTYGIQFTNYANAIDIRGGHIGACIIGIDVRGDNIQTIHNINIADTIEGCSNAVRLVGALWDTINLNQCYFEGNSNAVYAGAGKQLTINQPFCGAGGGGTNIVLLGTKKVTINDPYFFDATGHIHADANVYGLQVNNPYFEAGSSYNIAAINSIITDTNIVISGGSYYGPSINGGGLSQLADTNWVIAQFSSLGGLVYSSGVTNALVMTNNAAGETGYRTNIWQGQVSVPTVITTNTISMVTATAGTYVRHYVSTNKYVTIGAGPVNVVSYLFRSGAAGTVSGHYEIYAVDSVTGQMTELTSSTTHTIAETVPTLHQFTMSVPSDYTPANQLYVAVAFKLDSVVNGQTFNFVSGSNYDGHISFARPLSSATITMSQVAGLAAALTDTTNNAAGSTNYTITATNQTFTYVRTINGQGTNNTTQATNDLNTLVKTYTNETTLRVYVTNLDNTILTPATATNTMPLYGGFWRLVISTPAAITNLTGVTAGVYTYGTLVLSNSLATTLTNYVQINAIPMGYAATNSVAVLGKNAYVVPAGKQVRLLIDCEGINQTNWAIISQ